MRLLTVIPELRPFLERLRPRFTRRQFRHLARYVVGLVASRRKTIRSIARSTTERFDQSSLNRFINSEAWETGVLSEAVDAMAIEDHERCAGGEVLLVIDDTLLEKFGEAMESVGYLYSTKDKKPVLSHDLVSMLLVCSCGEVVPVDLRQYVKARVSKEEKREFKTRIELAREMIESLRLPGSLSRKRVVVLFDSWYLCREIVDAIKRRGWHFVGETKSNRNVSVNRAMERNLSDLVSLEGEHDCDGVVTRGERRYAYRFLNGGRETFMPSLHHPNGVVKIIAERELDGKDDVHYVVTDLLDLSPEEFISLYKRRHLTEEFYRDAKQNLGMGKYMVRGHEAVNRHWWLVFIAYNALNHLRRTIVGLEGMTVGQLCEWVEERCEQIKWSGQVPLGLPVT